METKRYFWVFDRTGFDQIRLPEFTLLEGVLIVASLASLALYLALVVILDRRSRKKRKKEKQLAWLERWMENARLSEGELAQLDRLAGEGTPAARLRLLGDPVSFETRIHHAVKGGWRGGLVAKLRAKLRYGSDNLRAAVISTRQLLPEDAVRVALWRGGLPHHYYGKVVNTGPRHFTVALHSEAVKGALSERVPLELFFLRGQGLEYRFSCLPTGPAPGGGGLVLEHALTQLDQLPRNARLPLLLRVVFREHAFGGGDGTAPAADASAPAASVPAPAGELPAAPKEKGLVLDLSEGGFSIAHGRQIPPGNFIEFDLPLKKGRLHPRLVGKVLDCRPFSGGQWLSRCELRGVSGKERDLLHQVVRLEQKNRMKALAPIRRHAEKAG
ncbi:MAG: PilZ domain-containing protein [bacterium]